MLSSEWQFQMDEVFIWRPPELTTLWPSIQIFYSLPFQILLFQLIDLASNYPFLYHQQCTCCKIQWTFCVLFLPDMAVVVNSLSQAIKSLGFPDTRFFRVLSYFHYWIFFISSSGSTSCNAYLYVGMPHSICIGWKHKYLNEQVNK